jgi:alkylhydroperoxidase family enzyme
MTRLRLRTQEELDRNTISLFQGIEERGGKVPDLYRLLANAPDLLRAWVDLAWPLRNGNHADRSLRELVIMRTAQLAAARYEWAHHWHMAISAGITEIQLRNLHRWRQNDHFDRNERVILSAADELVGAGKISEATFAALTELFSEAAIIQLVLTVAFYICVARFAGAFELDIEPAYRHVPSLDGSD